jgi:type IV pilus assembly protein PilN
MAVRVPINLASEPFRRDRPLLVASIAAAVLLLGVFAMLVTLIVSASGHAVVVQREISQLQTMISRVAAQQAQLESVLRKPENAVVLERSVLLNALLTRKGISWTRLFDDLDKVMPHDVRLIIVRPQVTGDNQVSLDMVVAAQSPDPVLTMFSKLSDSPQFGAPTIQARIPPSQTEPLLRYRVSVNYAQKL